jgi:RimJ/RimL family protein N-acetyltransferase
MSDRFKDFSHNDFRYEGPTTLVLGPVSVSIISWKSSLPYEEVKMKNDDSIAQYSVIDNSSLPKISWGIDYNDQPVGGITVWAIDTKNKMCKISYWVDKDHRRRGIASAAIAMVCDQVYDSLDMEEIEVPILESNEPSKNLIQSMFFTMAGYEVLTDRNGAASSHEIYLQRKPEVDETSLTEYVMEKYESLREEAKTWMDKL